LDDVVCRDYESAGPSMVCGGVLERSKNLRWSLSMAFKPLIKTSEGFYQWLLSPGILPAVNFINEWGLTLLGVSLILGIFVRLSSVLGAVLMLLYYFPVLIFPYAGKHSYLVDEHIIYALVLLLLAAMRAGRIWGLDARNK